MHTVIFTEKRRKTGAFAKKAVVNLLEILYNIKVAEMRFFREEYLNGK